MMKNLKPGDFYRELHDLEEGETINDFPIFMVLDWVYHPKTIMRYTIICGKLTGGLYSTTFFTTPIEKVDIEEVKSRL